MLLNSWRMTSVCWWWKMLNKHVWSDPLWLMKKWHHHPGHRSIGPPWEGMVWLISRLVSRSVQRNLEPSPSAFSGPFLVPGSPCFLRYSSLLFERLLGASYRPSLTVWSENIFFRSDGPSFPIAISVLQSYGCFPTYQSSAELTV